jgi:hypothetical protein
MALNPDKFGKIAESLRQYRRAELSDFRAEVGENPVDLLYVDPHESDAILKTVLLNNTTFLIGRKGTGKSTIFSKAQTELRKISDVISIYIDVKSLYELVSDNDVVIKALKDASVSENVLHTHGLRKAFLGAVIADLIKEVKQVYDSKTLIQRWLGDARAYVQVIAELEKLAQDVKEGRLSQQEIPILRTISAREKGAQKTSVKSAVRTKVNVAVGIKPELKSALGAEAFDETIRDNELYQEYADAVLRSFPFQELLARIRELLQGAGLKRLFVFFDDFSELAWVDQKLFVDVILSPLNNSSNEMVKLKVAGYPGRIYYGKIDPGKVDTIGLDFYNLYKSQDIQTSESAAVNYLERLLLTRFKGFGEDIQEYFDRSFPMSVYYKAIFEVTMNVPRLIGYILHFCYLDRISKRQPITGTSIRLAAQKYYETVVRPYFDRRNRFALEPFERKLDRHNQQQLLGYLIEEARTVRRGISTGQIGGRFFDSLNNPPVSHFAVAPSAEDLLSGLELNFLLTKYHEMRDKNGKDVSIYAFYYGLCETERFSWGYPKGRRDDRSYFVQRCFNYNGAIQRFLEKKQTIRCDTCGACFRMDKKENFEFYKWRCPDCQSGTCAIVSLGDDFKKEVENLSRDTMLPQVELAILEVLNEEGGAMRAGKIASLIDSTYQLVGRRTSKLYEMGLVKKVANDSVTRSSITGKARQLYFGMVDNPEDGGQEVTEL